MAVTSLTRFASLPNRVADHMAATVEAIGHLRRLGLAATAIQPVAGGDVGSITTTLNFENNAAWAAGMQAVLADEGWQEFWGRVGADQPAQQVENSLFSDIDPSYQPDPSRPIGAISATQWKVFPGRLGDFMGHVMTGAEHITRLGGAPRVMQSLVGLHPNTVLIGIGHADLDAAGAFTDASQADAAFQEFWMGVSANPSADVIRSGIYVNMTPAEA